MLTTIKYIPWLDDGFHWLFCNLQACIWLRPLHWGVVSETTMVVIPWLDTALTLWMPGYIGTKSMFLSTARWALQSWVELVHGGVHGLADGRVHGREHALWKSMHQNRLVPLSGSWLMVWGMTVTATNLLLQTQHFFNYVRPRYWRTERINNDMQLTPYSPGIWVLHRNFCPHCRHKVTPSGSGSSSVCCAHSLLWSSLIRSLVTH